ncbi:MAG: transketolase [Synergistales bacterium]|nr:transketolase [Synergistales bacterium]
MVALIRRYNMKSVDSVDLTGFPVEELPGETVGKLSEAARIGRAMSVLMTTVANSGHPAGSLSSMEMYLMAYGVADLNPENCDSHDRDYVVISHGHTSPGAYSTLAYYGFISPGEVLAHFRQSGSPFQGHVEREVPGIDWGTGNLGQGLSAAVGYALAQKARGYHGKVFLLGSDGEQTKGQIAEARRIAVKQGLCDITALVDWNHIQISGNTDDIMPANIPVLWKADGWEILECDGHSFQDIYRCLLEASKIDSPVVILCHTVMGKGVSFMENIPEYHGKAVPRGDLFTLAMRELGWDPSHLVRIERERKLAPPRGREILPPRIRIDTGEPGLYQPGDRTDNRSAFGKALEDIGMRSYGDGNSDPLLVFDCDLAGSVKTSGFAKACPEWFVQAGIQEHAVATIAGAASSAGVGSLWADFGVFGLSEAYNQQRLNDINRASLKLVLTHVGLDVGEDGMTHQSIDYVGLLRNTFGWRLVVPADPNQTDRATRWMLSEPGNICLAMGRSKTMVLSSEDGTPFYGKDRPFEYGKFDLLRDGKDGAIMAMGSMLPGAFKAWEILKERGIMISLYVVSAPLEPDDQAIRQAASTGRILTCEDHNVNSGMGSIVGSRMTALGLNSRFTCMGVHKYGTSGAADEVFAEMGLSPGHIVKKMEELLR